MPESSPDGAVSRTGKSHMAAIFYALLEVMTYQKT